MYQTTRLETAGSNEPVRRQGAIEVALSQLSDRLDALYRAVEAVDARTRPVRAARSQPAPEQPPKGSVNSPVAGAVESAAARVNEAVMRLEAVSSELDL